MGICRGYQGVSAQAVIFEMVLNFLFETILLFFDFEAIFGHVRIVRIVKAKNRILGASNDC